MLIRFEVANYRSVDDAVELSMVAVDQDRPQARRQPRLDESLLTLAGIYGPNASGKSNVLKALVWLRDAVRNSFREWDDNVPIEPFAFGTPDRTTELVLETAIDGVRFEYLLEVDGARVHYEALFHYPERKRRRIFERDGNDLKLQRGLGALSGIREILTGRALVLTLARRFDDPLVARFATDIVRMQYFGAGYLDGRRPPTTTFLGQRISGQTLRSLLTEGDREHALGLLRLADLGIEDVLVEEEQLLTASGDIRSEQRVRLLHRVGDALEPLDFAAESEGTKAWFHLIGPVLTAFRDGSVVVFDELDASLHPTLSAELLRLFGDPAINPHGAQLVFASHDTSLLNYLNRDEVWLTEKQPGGATRLGALAEFAGERVRKSQNLESAYLHGRFGALPQVDQAAFLRAVGLIG